MNSSTIIGFTPLFNRNHINANLCLPDSSCFCVIASLSEYGHSRKCGITPSRMRASDLFIFVIDWICGLTDYL